MPVSGPLASKDSKEPKSRASIDLTPTGLANDAGAMKKGRRTKKVEERIAGVFGLLWRVCVEQTSCSNFYQRNGRRSEMIHLIYTFGRMSSEDL